MFTTDNRWSPGGSGTTVPDDARAAYAARWIDQGDTIAADVVPDRQGFAYNSLDDRDELIGLLANEGDQMRRTPGKTNLRDASQCVEFSTVIENTPVWAMYQRRAGGYIYVDAWLKGTT